MGGAGARACVIGRAACIEKVHAPSPMRNMAVTCIPALASLIQGDVILRGLRVKEGSIFDA